MTNQEFAYEYWKLAELILKLNQRGMSGKEILWAVHSIMSDVQKNGSEYVEAVANSWIAHFEEQSS